MSVLSRVATPQDLKNLSFEELGQLSAELREFIIHHVSQTGGHLASSLGAVELTLALHYVFGTPEDKILWDVGHQAYAHKIITGRKELFPRLRQMGGLSPFINPAESIYDPFVSGHAGNAISAATGICEAFELTGNPARVIAVIGDGSLSNGLTFEGLNFAGVRKQNLIVVLNDNEMFISSRVGALADYLSRLMTSRTMRGVKEGIKSTLHNLPLVGETLYKLSKHIETNLKGVVVSGSNLFEEMGFRYIGPIDGHNIAHLVEGFQNISLMQGPIFMHIITEKGRGYTPAVMDPEHFHGVGTFHKINGEAKTTNKTPTYADVFGQAMLEMGRTDKRIVAVTAAMASGTGLKPFARAFPERFFDVGIAEGHAVTMAAGMAKYGLKPVVAIYSTFLQRSYDEIIHDVALQNAPVVFAIDRAGLVGPDGSTHHGLFDIAYLRSIPNMTVLIPRDQHMLRCMLSQAFSIGGPVAIRYPRDHVVEAPLPCSGFCVGRVQILKTGTRAVVFCAGPGCYRILDACRDIEGVAVVDLCSAKPLDRESITDLVRGAGGRFLVVEDGTAQGGIGSALLEVLSGLDLPLTFRLLGLPDRFIEHGGSERLREQLGLDAQGIVASIRDIL